MNNHIKALSLSCIILSPPTFADFSNTIYGDFRFSAGLIDRSSTGSDGFAAVNNASRLGFKGTVGNSELKAIYHLQAGSRNDSSGSGFTSRFYFAGLKSATYGSVIYGRHSTAYKMSGLRVDPFYDTSAGLGNGGATYGLSGMTNGFTNNSLAYITPVLFDSVTLNAAIYIDDSDENEHDTNFGIQYVADGITAGVQHAIIGDSQMTGGIANSTGLDSSTRLYAGYKADKWSIGGSYEFQDGAVGIDSDYLYLSGTYKVLDDTRAALSVGVVGDGTSEGTGWQIGVFHNILPKTEVYVLYSATYLDNNASIDDTNVLMLGVSHKFSLSH